MDFKQKLREGWAYALTQTALRNLRGNILSDRTHDKMVYFPRLGYWHSIKNPRGFNEKVLHRKYYTRSDLFSKVSDKYSVREYVREQWGGRILNEVYYVTSDPSSIPFDELPNKFVVKANHGSGWNLLVDNFTENKPADIIDMADKWLSSTYGKNTGEYWYSHIEPKIIIEKYLTDQKHTVPLDYKFFVFHGRVEYIQVDYDRFGNHSRRFYDRDWNAQNFRLKFPLGSTIGKPAKLEEMIEAAESLGSEFDFVRVDLYQPNGERVVFGELTLAPGSGYEGFYPTQYDFELGELW